MPVQRGPIDLRQLPEHFGRQSDPTDYGDWDIEILAEINAAPRLSPRQILREAKKLNSDGADVVDLGCNPGETWSEVGIDVAHAFYLGYEMAKAVTAPTLGKNYRQDEALDWGMLTIPELTRRERRAPRMTRRQDADDEPQEAQDEPCD